MQVCQLITSKIKSCFFIQVKTPWNNCLNYFFPDLWFFQLSKLVFYHQRQHVENKAFNQNCQKSCQVMLRGHEQPVIISFIATSMACPPRFILNSKFYLNRQIPDHNRPRWIRQVTGSRNILLFKISPFHLFKNNIWFF